MGKFELYSDQHIECQIVDTHVGITLILPATLRQVLDFTERCSGDYPLHILSRGYCNYVHNISAPSSDRLQLVNYGRDHLIYTLRDLRAWQRRPELPINDCIVSGGAPGMTTYLLTMCVIGDNYITFVADK